jgi:hypothetical protein
MKKTEALLEYNKKVRLEVKTEKTKYVVVSRHQNARQNRNLLTADKSFGISNIRSKLHSRRNGKRFNFGVLSVVER